MVLIFLNLDDQDHAVVQEEGSPTAEADLDQLINDHVQEVEVEKDQINLSK